MQLKQLENTILGSGLAPSFKKLAGKIFAGERITPVEGLLLYEEADTGYLGLLAEYVRQKKNGQDVFYIRNFHIEPTNVCVNRCRFCSYSHHYSKERWEMSVEEILEKVREQDLSVREVHITGAVHPDRDIYYYSELVEKIKAIRPDLHVKAYSAVELDYMINKAGLTYKKGLELLLKAGLDSIPGGGAEIFDEALRRQICGQKTSSKAYLEIHETAHRKGIPSNATILYGHLESYPQRVDHLERLRRLQDRTGGFNAFIPLKFRNSNHEMGDIPEVSIPEDMRNYAISRIYLDNFPHLKSYWPAIGKKNAEVSLSFGVDDLDGTINDSTRIYSLAGAEEQNPAFTVSEMRELITRAGRVPVERDSLYNPV